MENNHAQALSLTFTTMVWGVVVALDEVHKNKKEVLVLSRCTNIVLNSKDNPIPNIERKSHHKIGNRITFKHEFSSSDCYKTGEIIFVYNNGEGYFVKLDEECINQHHEVFFLSNKMLIN
jgi:hypothetical protein